MRVSSSSMTTRPRTLTTMHLLLFSKMAVSIFLFCILSGANIAKAMPIVEAKGILRYTSEITGFSQRRCRH